MNDRIRELSEQAKNYAESKMQLTGVKDSAAYDKMFAELIVRECVGLCSDPVVVLQHWGLDSKSE